MQVLGNRRGCRLPWRWGGDADEHRISAHATGGHEGTHAEEDVARCAGTPRRADLRVELVGIPRAASGAIRVVARPDVAGVHVLPYPPGQQRRVALRGLPDGPVELRREVVHPTLAQPAPRIGVKLVVRVEALDRRRAPGAPDAERADPHLDPRL